MIADYRTERGAKRYAAEIMRKFPSVKAYPVPSSSFGYNVAVETPQHPGSIAMADKRPRNYAVNPFQHRIASKALEKRGE